MTFTPSNRAKSRVGPLLVPAVLLFAALSISGNALAKDQFRIAWSIYVGWMPWDYAAESGIVKKWADKYGIEIEVVQINDYVESINQYTAGAFDGCVMTNMDALTIPAAGGVDSTALIVGDFSNGNDAVILRTRTSSRRSPARRSTWSSSPSRITCWHGRWRVSGSERDVTVVNTSDADMVSAFASGDVTAVVTWNPLVSEILAMPNATRCSTRARSPARSSTSWSSTPRRSKANPALGKALVGAWYETMAIMSKDDEAGRAARTAMGKAPARTSPATTPSSPAPRCSTSRPTPWPSPSRNQRGDRADIGYRAGRHPADSVRVCALCRGVVVDPADGGAAGPLHRLRARRGLQGGAHRRRHHAFHRARSAAARAGAADAS
jgi:NitT/TauT family transport system substrate-binding protein